jgi:hypothetical protein
VRTARAIAGLVLAVAVIVAAVRLNAAVHGIGYHWLPDPIRCVPPDHAVYWWQGRTQRAGCGESLTITAGTQ